MRNAKGTQWGFGLSSAIIVCFVSSSSLAGTYFVDGSCSTSGTGASLACGATGPTKTIMEAVKLACVADSGHCNPAAHPITINVRGAHDTFDGVYNEYIGIWGDGRTSAPGGGAYYALNCTATNPCVLQGCSAPVCGTNETPTIAGWSVKADWISDGGGVYHRSMETASEWIFNDSPDTGNLDPIYVAQGTGKTMLQSWTNTLLASGHHYFSAPNLYVRPTGDCDPRVAGCKIWVPTRRALMVIGTKGGPTYCPDGVGHCPPTNYVTIRRFALEGSRWLSFSVANNGGITDHLTVDQVSVNGGGRFGMIASYLTNLTMSNITVTNMGRGVNHDPGGIFAWRFFHVRGGGITNLTTSHLGSSGSTGDTGAEPWVDAPWNSNTTNGAQTLTAGVNIKQSDNVTFTNHVCEDVAGHCFLFDVSHDIINEGFRYSRVRIGVNSEEFTPDAQSSPPYTRNYNLTIRNGSIDNAGWNDAGAVTIFPVSALGAGEFSVKIYNNMISRMSHSGISIRNIDRAYVWNNTIVGSRAGFGYTGKPNTVADGIKLWGAITNSEFKNNIVSGQNASNYAIIAGATSNIFDYNLLQNTADGTRDCAVRWNATFNSPGTASGGTCYSSLSAFSAAQPTKELHGLEGNPQFVASGASPPDLHIQSSSAARDVGTTISDVSIDYDRQTRSGSWDIGADEQAGITAPQLIDVEPLPGS